MILNELDIVLMSVLELNQALDLHPGRTPAMVRSIVAAAKAVAHTRRDLRVHYLPSTKDDFIGPCVCVNMAVRGCPGCNLIRRPHDKRA